MFYGMSVKEYIALQTSGEYYYEGFYDSGKGLYNLTQAGELVVINKKGKSIIDWYKDAKTSKPWFPKAKNFKSLVKQMEREGDI